MAALLVVNIFFNVQISIRSPVPVLLSVRTVSGGSLYGPVPSALTAATAIVYLVDGVSPVKLYILLSCPEMSTMVLLLL